MSLSSMSCTSLQVLRSTMLCTRGYRTKTCLANRAKLARWLELHLTHNFSPHRTPILSITNRTDMADFAGSETDSPHNSFQARIDKLIRQLMILKKVSTKSSYLGCTGAAHQKRPEKLEVREACDNQQCQGFHKIPRIIGTIAEKSQKCSGWLHLTVKCPTFLAQMPGPWGRTGCQVCTASATHRPS
jgi:hypothetical protein